MRKSDDTLHFYKNGQDIGNCFGKTPKRLFAVVDIYGQAEEITITGIIITILLSENDSF